MAGHIIGFIGSKGGVGKSLLSANFAFAAAQEYKQRIALIDFDQRAAGDQNLITGLKSPKSLKDFSEIPSVNQQTAQAYMAHHKLGVSFLSFSIDNDTVNLPSADSVHRNIKALAQIFPLVILDLGSEVNEYVVKVLESVNLVFVVATPDLLVLNQTKKLLQEFQTMMMPKEMVQIVLNQAVKGHPLSNDFIERQLNKTLFSSIGKDDANCITSLSKSTPLLSYGKTGPFAEGLIELVKKIKVQNLLARLATLQKPPLQVNATTGATSAAPVNNNDNDAWTDLKFRIHRSLLDELDLKKQSNDQDPRTKLIVREKTKKVVVDLLNKEENKSQLKTREAMNQMVKEILDEALGFGPLEDLLADKTISEIMVVGPKKIYFEQAGKNKLSPITFTNERQVLTVIERIVAPIGRRIDEKTPYVDARLPDGSRVHAIIPPCAIDGSIITIRKFPEQRLTYKDLVQFGSMTQEMADFLRIAVEGKRNIVVSGGTGSGKTTLINILAGFIPSNERIITVEDSAELDLPQEHVVRLETRPPTIEGEGEIDIRTLVKQTLRMKPDRIVVGECRGGEALDMLQAMNTGHDGSLTTIHSNSPRDCIARLETLVQYAGAGISPRAIKEMIASAVHLIVQQTRLEDGSRRVMNITEVAGIQGEVVTLQDIFTFRQEGIGKNGKVIGKYQATGFIPKFVEMLERKGYKVPRGIFNNAA
jgi:pilus assembly protein CpaF